MTVTYEDGSTKVVDVTESMFSETDKEKLNNVGQYNLTVNYGDKTATMYANVVDERYLLKEVVEANIDEDVTLTVGNSTCQIDVDNKIIKYTDVEDGWTGYTWLSNNVTYDYEPGDGCNKTLASDWAWHSKMYHTMGILDILETGKDSEGDPWTIESVEKDGINYVLTAKNVYEEYERTYKWVFNDDFLLKIECEDNDPETWEYNFNYAPITLEVLPAIKALEDSATISVGGRIEDLKSVMSKYLESDFEVSVFVNSNNTTYLYKKYDADNKILREYDSDVGEYTLYWVNGDYYYEYVDGDSSLYKDDASNWEDRCVMVSCFTFDNAFDANNITVDISDDGQYYELVLTVNDDGEVLEYKYVFNDEEIAKVDIKNNGVYMGSYTYNKTNVMLEVPADIKALEDDFDIFEP